MRIRHNLYLASPAVIALFALLLVDIIIGDYEFFIIINQGITNQILDFACVYLFILLFSASFILSLIIMFTSHKSSSKASGLLSIISGFLAYGVGSLLKILFGRPRPFEVLPARVIGLIHTTSFSFPSTTTMLVFGLAFPILFHKPRFGTSLVALSFLVGFSVVYTGFHFIGDVIAGAFFSLIITLFMDNLKPSIMRFLDRFESVEETKILK
ncbi:MAG: phosphatase PAP2 family protein [Candidatus Methylarchaceae archaeon HK01M]|nr:phosphatase PAP2 family protein [Candidatus Methylarchaceae archaeon HK01M]